MTSLVWSPANVVACVAGELLATPEDVIEALSNDFDALTLFRKVVRGEESYADLITMMYELV